MSSPANLLNLARWADQNPFADHIPIDLRPIVAVVPEKYGELADLRMQVELALNQSRFDEIGSTTTHKQRRAIERRVADYLDGHGLYPEIAEKLRECRRAGAWGVRDGSSDTVVAWDTKCGLTRLCPDEVREEQRRLVRRYARPALDLATDNRWRVQKAVLTWPNVPAGRLAPYKWKQFEIFRRWLGHRACRNVKGALCSQEDPLAAGGDWNVHLNVILMVSGKFDWAEARAAWFELSSPFFSWYEGGSDYQTDFKQLPRFSERELERALVECIKYPVKHITEKPDRKKDQQDPQQDPESPQDPQQDPESPQDPRDAQSSAPGLVDWPADRFVEWWEAGKRVRRTRSYGVLFGIGDPKDEPLQGVTWLGRIWWDVPGRCYAVERVTVQPVRLDCVDLIQADKSARAGSSGGQIDGPDPPGWVQ